MLVQERADRDLLRQQLLELVPGLQLVVARRLGAGADAQDALQEILTRALAAFDRGQPATSEQLPAFVHGIARHVIADVARNEIRRRETSLPDSLHTREPSPLESMVSAETRSAMQRALRLLDPADRDLLRRCFVHGERLASIAHALNVPAARLRKRKSRALARLRELLHDSGHIPAPPPNTET